MDSLNEENVLNEDYSFRSYDNFEERGRSKKFKKGKQERRRKGSSGRLKKNGNSLKICSFCLPALSHRLNNKKMIKESILSEIKEFY